MVTIVYSRENPYNHRNGSFVFSPSPVFLSDITLLNSLLTVWNAPVTPRKKKQTIFGCTDTIWREKKETDSPALLSLPPSRPPVLSSSTHLSSLPFLPFFSSSSFSLSSFLFFFFNKTFIFLPELSKTAQLVKAVNRTGTFYL